MREHIRREKIWGREGFREKYLKGHGIDIGAGDFPLEHPDIIHYDRSIHPSHDAVKVWQFEPSTFDFVYSAHCLEHLPEPEEALARWWELLKPGGHLILILPDFTLYEHQQFPSAFNSDHKQVYSLSLPEARNLPNKTLMNPLQDVRMLPGAWIKYARVNDDGFDYNAPKDRDQTLGGVLCEIELVARKGFPYGNN
jgi:SAM-dependent methyltransferase